MQYKNSLPKNVVDEIDRMFQNQMQQHQQQREEYHKSVVARLSPAARAADERMSAIDRDPMIPPQQKMQQIQMIRNSLPQNVRNELDTAMRG
uniref:SXP/RAL-2 family protein Ani s 5-like cation-binding domain-containing protein n=1 Tax=Acrobeloides nanus TaxID=290746 RepID=A0A914E971_9BILA